VLTRSDTLFVVIAALAFDALIGDPDWLWRRLPHPVVLIGSLIGSLDHAFNQETRSSSYRKFAGVGVVILLLGMTAATGILIEAAFRLVPFGNLLLGLIASSLIAQRSLFQHVSRVKSAFAGGGLAAARDAVSMIVGRDPARLDEAGVCRAAIESCAENFADGVVAPVFWLTLLGLPGLIAYKAINTADSMIGHRTARHAQFGWAAARTDDLLNLIPARLSGLLLAAVAPISRGSIVTSLKTMLRDANKHRSPNAGWPEGAMAGALDLALAGPRRYGEHIVDDPFLNDGARKQATPDDIGRALTLLMTACVLQATIYAILALVV
jgi:adenosylcobinamide-phosphate synthase